MAVNTDILAKLLPSFAAQVETKALICADCGHPRSRGSFERCRRCADRVRKRKPDGTPFKPALELTGEEKSRAAALIRRHRLACPKCEDCKRGVCEYEARQVVFLERER